MKIRPGAILPGLPARSWNRHEDAARIVLDGGLPAIGGLVPAAGQVFVKNNSGAAVERHRLLGIDGVQIPFATSLIANQVSPLLDGVSPVVATHTGKFVIAVDHIPDGKIGPAAISGLAIAELDNPATPPPHPYADVAAASDKLTGNWYGAARILTTDVTGGTRWALVQLGPFVAPVYPGKVTETGGISNGGSGDCDIYVNGSSEATITAHLSWAEGTMDAAENAECFVQYFLGDSKWRIISLDCEA